MRAWDEGWLSLWYWVAGREGQLPGGLQWATREQSLPRLSFSLALGAFLFVIRGPGCLWVGLRSRGLAYPSKGQRSLPSGRHTQVSHLRRVASIQGSGAFSTILTIQLSCILPWWRLESGKGSLQSPRSLLTLSLHGFQKR